MARGGSRGSRGSRSSGGGGRSSRSWTSKRYTHYHGMTRVATREAPDPIVKGILGFLLGCFLFAGLVAWIATGAQQKMLDIQMSNYASRQYKWVTRESSTPEDHLMIVFGTWNDCSGFDYIAWVGDHINDDTFDKVGSSYSLLGKLLVRKVSKHYGGSLAEDLAVVLTELAEKIRAASPDGCYTCRENHSGEESQWIDRSRVYLGSTAELDQAVKDFTEITGIPLTLLIEDEDDIFTMPNT